MKLNKKTHNQPKGLKSYASMNKLVQNVEDSKYCPHHEQMKEEKRKMKEEKLRDKGEKRGVTKD